MIILASDRQIRILSNKHGIQQFIAFSPTKELNFKILNLPHKRRVIISQAKGFLIHQRTAASFIKFCLNTFKTQCGVQHQPLIDLKEHPQNLPAITGALIKFPQTRNDIMHIIRFRPIKCGQIKMITVKEQRILSKFPCIHRAHNLLALLHLIRQHKEMGFHEHIQNIITVIAAAVHSFSCLSAPLFLINPSGLIIQIQMTNFKNTALHICLRPLLLSDDFLMTRHFNRYLLRKSIQNDLAMILPPF